MICQLLEKLQDPEKIGFMLKIISPHQITFSEEGLN